MALTQSAWTVKSINGGRQTKASCTVTATTAENDAYTLRTPAAIDTTKPYQLFFVCSAAPDSAQTVPIDIWVGFEESAVMSGNDSTVACSNGARFKQIIDDAISAVTPLVYSFLIDPNLPVADVVTAAAIGSGLKSRAPVGVCHLFNINGNSTLLAHTATYTIIQ